MSQAELQRETEQIMRGLAAGIQEVLDDVAPYMGFALIVFKFKKPGMSNYISNGERSDMIEALKEAAAKLEAGEDISAAIGSVQ